MHLVNYNLSLVLIDITIIIVIIHRVKQVLLYEGFVSGQLTQAMERLDVFISVKPKPKQPSKVAMCTLPPLECIPLLSLVFSVCDREEH